LRSVTEVLGSNDIHKTPLITISRLSAVFVPTPPPAVSCVRVCTGSMLARDCGASVWMSVAAVVAEAASGAGNAVEATGADARSNVVGDVVHVQLTQVIAIG